MIRNPPRDIVSQKVITYTYAQNHLILCVLLRV